MFALQAYFEKHGISDVEKTKEYVAKLEHWLGIIRFPRSTLKKLDFECIIKSVKSHLQLKEDGAETASTPGDTPHSLWPSSSRLDGSKVAGPTEAQQTAAEPSSWQHVWHRSEGKLANTREQAKRTSKYRVGFARDAKNHDRTLP